MDRPPTTDHACDASGILTDAAMWVLHRDRRDQALIPEMRKRFGISTRECIVALNIAKKIKGGAHEIAS